jgi:hypothetical protein
VVKLNEASVATRYPEDLDTLERNFSAPVVEDILARTKEIMHWIRSQF